MQFIFTLFPDSIFVSKMNQQNRRSHHLLPVASACQFHSLTTTILGIYSTLTCTIFIYSERKQFAEDGIASGALLIDIILPAAIRVKYTRSVS